MPAKTGDLFATLTKAAWQLRLSLALTGGAAAAAALLLYAGIALVLDNLLTLEPATRVVMLVAFALAAMATAGWAIWRLVRSPLNRRRLAVRLERLHAIGDNRLINALHFAEDSELPPALREHFMAAASQSCATIEPGRVWDRRRWRRALGALVVAGALLLGYVVLFGAHAGNALHRFLHPRTLLMPLNVTQFEVTPGDTDLPEGADCLIRVQARKLGQPVHQLQILLATGQERLLHPMRSDGDASLFELRDLRRDLQYRLLNGNDESRWFTIAVRPAPKLDHLTLTVTPPAYSGQPTFTVPAEHRDLEALAGSRLQVSAGLPKGVSAQWRLEAAPLAQGGELDLILSTPSTLVLDLTDAKGQQHPRAWFCQLRTRPDQAPRIRFLNRDLNQRLGLGQKLTIQVLAEDDCGVGQMDLVLLTEVGEKPLKSWQLTQNLTRREELYVLTLDPERFAANASYRIIGRAWDRHDPRQMGLTTAPLMIHVVDLGRPELAVTMADNDLSLLYQHLSKALTQQKQLQGTISVRLRQYLDVNQLPGLRNAQQGILNELNAGLKLAEGLVTRQLIKPPLRDGLK